MIEKDLLQELIDELESTPEGKAEMDEARAWVKADREDFRARAERARLSWPKDYDGVLLGGGDDEYD